MILRRPYAFLIKYFRIIHIILFIIFTVLLFNFRKIYMFLVDYVKKGTFNYVENMSHEYVPVWILIILAIAIISGIFIYLLMKRKDKPSLFYILLTVYSSIGLILMIVYRNFYASLEFTSYETLSIIVYRDIMAFLYYLCYFFVAILFARGFGFDIKKFSFEKDRKELNLDVTDNEEVEVGVSIDKYDAIKHFRKEKRELSYYYKENKKIINAFGMVLFIVIVIFIYIYFFLNNKVYKEGSVLDIGNMSFKVLDSFITNEDRYHNVITNDSYFLITNLEINNKSTGSYYLDKEFFRINDDNNVYYPITSYCSSFDDIGNCYNEKSKIVSGSQQYMLVFKINYKSFDGYLELLKNKKDGYNFVRMKFSSKMIEVSEETLTRNNDYFNITNYEIKDSFVIEDSECENDVCQTVKRNIYPEFGNSLLKLNVSNIDNFNKEIIDNYLGIFYYVNGNRYVVSSDKVKTLKVSGNDIYLSAPKLYLEGNNIGICFRTRRKTIYINLGDSNE